MGRGNSSVVRKTVNGNEGDVRLNHSGAGSTSVASAWRDRLSFAEDTLRCWRVTRSSTEGKGALLPGCGKPGILGTVLSSDKRNIKR